MFLGKKARANNPKDVVQVQAETCQNPWKKCGNIDIAVSIFVDGEMLPICAVCWFEIADSDKQW